MRTFFEVCPEDFIVNYNKNEHHLYLANGSEILFRELKDGKGLGSLDLGFFYVDEAEEIQESIFDRLKGRLSLDRVARRCGWVTSNPPNEDHWIFRQFEKIHKNDKDFFVIHASTYENREHLPLAYIEGLEKMAESLKKKFLHGEYGFTPDGTPFYTGFNERFHKRRLTVNKYKPLLLGWDYGFRHPACAITQLDAPGRWGILREIMGADETIDKFADKVKGYLNIYFPNYPARSYGDPAGKQVSDKNEQTSEDILRSKGFNVISKPSTYRERKEIIEKNLSTIISGFPALMVDPSCKTIIDGFLGGYHYPMIREGQEFRAIKTEIPYKDGYYEHLMNALEYIAVNVFKPIPEPKRAKERQPRYTFRKVS